MRLAIPPPFASAPRPRLPLLGLLAPVAVAVVLALALRSPMLLGFAALGPVIAVSSLVDGRRQARADQRAATAARRTALERLESDLQQRHDELRRAMLAAHPGARAMLGQPRPSARPDMGVVLGLGDVPSGIELEPIAADDRPMAARASVLSDAPVLADPADGIGVIGPPELAAALARAIVGQLSWYGASAATTAVACARSPSELKRHCGVAVRIDTALRAEVIRHPDPTALGFIRPELISRAELAAELAGCATQTDAASMLPKSVDLEPMLGQSHEHPGETAFLLAESGPLSLDIVADGPHAVIGGTTGSGKSELLVSWLLAVAARCSPDEVTMLLFDFKGGSALDPLLRLPHVGGLVTDLDDRMVDRAARSLRAELRRREAALRSSGARSIAEATGLGRLIIVVDEFAALLDGRAELHDVFVDIAARGRSLGMHLILCTQRPAGVIRDALLANCGLRISLRVVSAEDSVAVVGVPAAATLPRGAPGRCLVSTHGEPARTAQVAVVAPDRLQKVVTGIAARWPSRSSGVQSRSAGWLPPLGPLWLEPLPAAELHPSDLLLGRCDRPDMLDQPLAVWRSSSDRSMAVVGARGSGKTTALATLACQLPAAIVVDGRSPAGIEQLCDGIERASAEDAVLIVDDLDVLVGRLAAEQSDLVVDLLVGALRDLPARFVLTMGSPVSSRLRSVLARIACTLVLRCASRDEHVLLGGESRDFDERLSPGAGRWDGMVLQVAQSRSGAPLRSALSATSAPPLHHVAGAQLLITSRPAARAAQLAGAEVRIVADSGYPIRDRPDSAQHGPGQRGLGQHGLAQQGPGQPDLGPDVLTIVDSASWLSNPALWRALNEGPVLIDACSFGEFRQLSRRSAPPPPLADLPDRAWLLVPERDPQRIRLQIPPP